MKRTCIHCGERFDTKEPLKPCKATPLPEGPPNLFCEGKPWGYAAMDPEKRAQCALQGARKIRDLGLRHQWTSDEARLAAQRGGLSLRRKRSGGKPNDPFL